MSFRAELRNAAWFVSALALGTGCTGGQTGESGQGETPLVCMGFDVTNVGLDEEVPGGFKPREVLELFQNKRAPGFVFPLDIDATERPLAPDDAASTTNVWVDFEPSGETTIPAHANACGPQALAIHGTFVVSTLDGTSVFEGEGKLLGTPENAWLEADEPAAPCKGNRSAMYVAAIEGVLLGQLCVGGQIVRFPTACGGYAQVPLDEVVAKELPLPSAVLDRLGKLELEVVWTEADRTPLSLDLSAGELACYDVNGYDDAREQPSRTSAVALDVGVSIPDVAIELREGTTLHSGAYDSDIAATVYVCSELTDEAIEALEPRLAKPLRSGRACLQIDALEHDLIEMKLSVIGEATTGTVDDEDDPLEIFETFEVREAAP